jgi:putative inorganic carbon (HCO3(-)) transporter
LSVKKYIKNYQIVGEQYRVILLFTFCSLIGLSQDSIGIALLPVALLISAFIFSYPAAGLYITAALLPFSRNIGFDFIGVTVNTPLEPLLLVVAGTTLFNFMFNGIDKEMLFHPLTKLVIVFISLIFVSCCFSTEPLISFRIAAQTIIYIIASYFGILYFSQSDPKLPYHFLLTSLFSFSVLALINFIRHSTFGFSRTVAWNIPNPYYTDHTIYSTMAAFMIPLAFTAMLWYYKKSLWKFNVFTCLFLLSSSALILSYSRAAMMGVAGALCLFIVWRYKIRWSYIGIAALIVAVYIFSARDQFYMQMKRNNADSKTKKTSVEDQFKSITNMNTDVSNMERLNRWSSAIRMIKDKPFLGFGYGMYQHKYFPYQKANEMTYISIHNSQPKYKSGTGGTTHSEYLLISSENGIITGVVYIALLVMSLYTVSKLVNTLTPADVNYYIVIGLGMSITTYLVHSFFNNFLDTSKICTIFFGMLACLVTIDLSNKTTYTTIQQ